MTKGDQPGPLKIMCGMVFALCFQRQLERTLPGAAKVTAKISKQQEVSWVNKAQEIKRL